MMDVPQSTNSEQAVIGALLMDNDVIDQCITLNGDSFFDHKHGKIFDAIRSMLAEGKPADIVTVDEFLSHRGVEYGGIGFLADIQRNTPSSAAVGRYVKIVHDRHVERKMIHAAAEIAELARDKSGDTVENRQGRAVALIECISDAHVSVASEKTSGEALQCLLARIADRMDSDNSLGGITTGFYELDELLDGLHPGKLVVIGALPSMGKSVLAENISRAAAKSGAAVRVQAYEVLASDWLARGASANQSIPLKCIRKATLTESMMDSFSAFVGEASGWNIVVDEAIIPVETICLKARAHKRKYGLNLLIVDHLALIPHDEKNDVKGLSNITASLKRLAKELGICVLLVSQLNRQPSNGSREPTMSDLRGSGSIEQDADVIIFVHRDWYFDKSKPAGEGVFIVAKHRDGPTGRILVGFNGDYVRFSNKPDYSFDPVVEKSNNAYEDL